jgi:hypothetical protein
VFTPHDNLPDPEVERGIANHSQPTQKIRLFTTRELILVIKKLHPHRAPGPDLITAQMLQEMPHKGYQALLYIFNAIRRLQYWPAPLKQTKIIMIQTSGKNPTDVASYRPISLLPILSKILENLLLEDYTGIQTSRNGYHLTNLDSIKLIQQHNNAIELQT